MKTSFFSALALAVALTCSELPMPVSAQSNLAKQAEAKRRQAQAEAARRAAAMRSNRTVPSARPKASVHPAPAQRNPMTSSRPNPSTHRSASKPNPARPSGGLGRPATSPTRPTAPAKSARPAIQPSKKPAVSKKPSAPALTPSRPATPSKPSSPSSNLVSPARPVAPPVTRPAVQPSKPAVRPPARPTIPSKPTVSSGLAPKVLPKAPTKPKFVPGKVTYPSRVTRPTPKVRPSSKHPSHFANRQAPRSLSQVISNNHRTTNISNVSNVTNVSKVTKVTNIHNVNSPRVTTVTPNPYVNRNWGNQWLNNRSGVWNTNRTIGHRPIVIQPNFQRSMNYAYRPTSWGGRPWWSSSSYHNWHYGSWNYGWNQSWQNYHRPVQVHPGYSSGYLPGYHQGYRDGRSSAAWGVTAWSLGSLIYQMGYNSYRNPYTAPPVQTRTTVINYTQPISVVAAKETPPSEEVSQTNEEKSSAAIARAREDFRRSDYLSALKATDESISYTPDDSTLHEFRALCLFALGRYGDAAGVLNPLLASGPGWDWATMASLYSDVEIYTTQLRKLEAYVAGAPDAADAAFLLGYHYMVEGYLTEAWAMFDRVTTLQPADTVAAQLRNLAQSSAPDQEEALTGTPEPLEDKATTEEDVTVDPIEPSDIQGTWKGASADGKPITLALGEDGKFSWAYEGSADGKVLSGDWSIDEEGRLVLEAEDVQIVADVSLDDDTLHFILSGGPVGDPGLEFKKS